MSSLSVCSLEEIEGTPPHAAVLRIDKFYFDLFEHSIEQSSSRNLCLASLK